LLIEETPYSIKLLFPWPYEVHHMDYKKENNGTGNLLLLSESLHSALTADMRREADGRWARKFHPKWKAPPEWKLFDDVIDEGVPF
jgi:hypothetical protein